jgi:hypothetical protein
MSNTLLLDFLQVLWKLFPNSEQQYRNVVTDAEQHIQSITVTGKPRRFAENFLCTFCTL